MSKMPPVAVHLKDRRTEHLFSFPLAVPRGFNWSSLLAVQTLCSLLRWAGSCSCGNSLEADVERMSGVYLRSGNQRCAQRCDQGYQGCLLYQPVSLNSNLGFYRADGCRVMQSWDWEHQRWPVWTLGKFSNLSNGGNYTYHQSSLWGLDELIPSTAPST